MRLDLGLDVPNLALAELTLSHRLHQNLSAFAKAGGGYRLDVKAPFFAAGAGLEVTW